LFDRYSVLKRYSCSELWISEAQGPLVPEIRRQLMDMAKTKKKRQGTDELPFAKNLKRIMDERNLTVRAIAVMAGVKQPSVVMSWLSNANPHDLKSVSRLAKALNMNFKELLLGETESETAKAMSINDLFDEKEMFEGICKINIQRLVPKKGK
jgi:transcriptional regulator with XRE-family HTH domain